MSYLTYLENILDFSLISRVLVFQKQIEKIYTLTNYVKICLNVRIKKWLSISLNNWYTLLFIIYSYQ